MTDVGHEHGGQSVAIHVRVVGKNAGGGDGQLDVFQRGVSVVDGHGRVVHRRNVDGDRGEIAVGGAVVRAIGERVAAVVVGGREVSETAVGIEIQHSMTDVTYENGGQRVAVHIRVVGKNARSSDGQTSVFECGISVVDGHGRVVHGNDGDRHGSGVGKDGPVGLKPHVLVLIVAIEVKRPLRIGVAPGVFNENLLTGLVIQVQIIGRSRDKRPKGRAINDRIRLE